MQFINLNKLEKGQPRKTVKEAPVKEAKQASKPVTSAKAPAKGASDGIFDKNNLFKQSWSDAPMNAADKKVGSNILAAKQGQALSYMSSYCTVDAALKNLTAFDSKLGVDTLINRAAAKAFKKVFKSVGPLTVSTVKGSTVSLIKNADRLNASQFKEAEVKQEGKHFTDSHAAAELEIHQVDNAVEALPISNPTSMIALHFTKPHEEVVIDGQY